MNMPDTSDQIISRLGFGCGRLKGAGEKAGSLRLIHTALDLGIRYFDTAPPYGLGASEPVLGEALKGRQEPVIIATKAGLPRPASPGLMQVARAVVKPIAGWIPGLRKAVLKGMAQRAQPGNFSADFIANSFETSLRLLQRDRIDCLLLHEASSHDQLASLQSLFERYVDQGMLGVYGSSTGEGEEQLVRFGSVSQYRCPAPGSEQSPVSSSDILHGAFRYVAPVIGQQIEADGRLKDQLASLLPPRGEPADAVGALAIAYVMSRCDNRLLLSTNDPQRLINTLEQLRHIAGSPDWRFVMQDLHHALDQVKIR